LLFIDIVFVILLHVLILAIISGMFSLCERKVMALFQLRIGPGLFLFGVLTPITDGIKLLLKNVIIIINVDYIYVLFQIYIIVVTMYLVWFLIPLNGFILLIDISYNIFIILFVHTLCNIISIFVMGFFLFSSTYVYLAAFRSLFLSLLNESCIIVAYIIFNMTDYYSFFSIKDLVISQLILENFYYLGQFICVIFVINILIDTLRLPFDYLECESELVAGIVTEFSGIFFVLYSLLEISHIIFNSILIAGLLIGGCYLSIKTLFIVFVVFLIPRCILIRVKLTQTYVLIVNYLYVVTMFNAFYVLFVKVLCIFL